MQEFPIQLPKELSYPFFFPTQNILWKERYSVTFQSNKPFIHETGYYAGISGLKPWEEPTEFIPLLRLEYEKLKSELESFFSKREFASDLAPMKQFIGIYLEFLFWSNKTPVCFPLDEIDNLTFKPVNIKDRIQFVLSRPKLHHSYIQIIELMAEQEKLFSKALLIENINITKNVQE